MNQDHDTYGLLDDTKVSKRKNEVPIPKILMFNLPLGLYYI